MKDEMKKYANKILAVYLGLVILCTILTAFALRSMIGAAVVGGY